MESPPQTTAHSNLSLQKTKFLLLSCAILAGLLQAWPTRFMMEPDGVNYLDVADAYLRHDWHNAINSYWSPLYSWLLALALGLTHASLYEESTLLHIVNFGLYLLALWAFTFFLRELMTVPSSAMSPRVWLVFALSLFAYAMLFLIGLGTTTPDVAVAALFFAATGVLIRIHRGQASVATYAGLGAILGAAYLAKAVMFPMAFVFLFCAAFGAPPAKRAAPRVLLALTIFLAISSLFIVPLSRHQGRLTYGDVGKLAYAAYVNDLQRPHWHGEVPGMGTPVHATRLIFSHPEADEFATPIGGTYPPWYDSAYWLDGVTPHFKLSAQLRTVRTTVGYYFTVLSAERALAVGFLALLLFSGDLPGYLRSFLRIWPVWLPAVAALGAYALVYVETRYIGAAVVVLWCSLFAALRLPDGNLPRKMANCVSLAVAISLFTTIAIGTAKNLASSLRPPVHTQWQVAAGLRGAGLHPGETVAVLGHFNAGDYWAHLAEVRVVADLPQTALSEFWEADVATREQVIAAFQKTGARFLVADTPPPLYGTKGWRQLGATGYYALPLRAPQ